MKKLTALITLTVLILLLAFSAMPVLATDSGINDIPVNQAAAAADRQDGSQGKAGNPATGDYSEIIAAVFVLSAGGVVTGVAWKREI